MSILWKELWREERIGLIEEKIILWRINWKKLA